MKKIFKSILGLIFGCFITAGFSPLKADVRTFFAWHYNDVTWRFDAQYICLVGNCKRDSAELAREKARLSAEYPNYMVKSVVDELGQNHYCPFCLSRGCQSQKLKIYFDMDMKKPPVNYCDACIRNNFVFARGEEGTLFFDSALDDAIQKYNRKPLGQLLSEYIVQLKNEREERMKRTVSSQSSSSRPAAVVYPTTISVMAREERVREEEAKMYERHRKCLEEEAFRIEKLKREKDEEERIARESSQDLDAASEQPVLPEHRDLVQSTAQALGVGQQEVHQEEAICEGDELFGRMPPEGVACDRDVVRLLGRGEKRVLPERTRPIEEDYDGR